MMEVVSDPSLFTPQEASVTRAAATLLPPFRSCCGRSLRADLFAWFALFPFLRLPFSLLQCHNLSTCPPKRYPSSPPHPKFTCAVNTQSSRHLSFVARRRLNDFLIAVSTTTLPLHRFAKIKPPLFMLYNSNERAVVRTLLYYVPERSAFLSYGSFISPPAFRSLLHTLHYSIQGFAELVLLVLSPSHDPTYVTYLHRTCSFFPW